MAAQASCTYMLSASFRSMCVVMPTCQWRISTVLCVLVFERKRNTVMTVYDNKNNRMYYIGCLADLNEDNESTPENQCESRWLCATVVHFLYCKQ